ncbi:hypothetical protein [Methanocaldococcus villosus]|uniref:hypothetical protein n=2 Tax=Methanocaldococcus villosus TaxID=667126 RepID=UPI00373AEF35
MVYLYENIGGAKDIGEVFKNSPFENFIYFDHNALMLMKSNNNSIYKELLIFINGIYIWEDNIAIKAPLTFIARYYPIDDFEYYNGLLIKCNNRSLLKKPKSDLINYVPKDYKDVVIYNGYSLIAIKYDVKDNKTLIYYVFNYPFGNKTVITREERGVILNISRLVKL